MRKKAVRIMVGQGRRCLLPPISPNQNAPFPKKANPLISKATKLSKLSDIATLSKFTRNSAQLPKSTPAGKWVTKTRTTTSQCSRKVGTIATL